MAALVGATLWLHLRSQGDFAQSARVQEIINAVALSHREGRWVPLPLAAGAGGAPNPGERGGARG